MLSFFRAVCVQGGRGTAQCKGTVGTFVYHGLWFCVVFCKRPFAGILQALASLLSHTVVTSVQRTALPGLSLFLLPSLGSACLFSSFLVMSRQLPFSPVWWALDFWSDPLSPVSIRIFFPFYLLVVVFSYQVVFDSLQPHGL